MKILFAGDIVGSPGRRAFARFAVEAKSAGVNVIVANGENAAAGNGITVALVNELTKAGADVITLGDHTWGQKELESSIGLCQNLVRPANYQKSAPGKGWIRIETAVGPLIVVNLQGQVFMAPVDNPFSCAEQLLKTLPKDAPVVVDFHAEASSEKIAMGYFLDGRVAAVVGTHTHCQTSDAQILLNGTAFISDLGMTGTAYSVLGRDVKPVLKKFLTGIPAKFDIANGVAKLEGAIVEIDRTTHKAVSIQAVRWFEQS